MTGFLQVIRFVVRSARIACETVGREFISLTSPPAMKYFSPPARTMALVSSSSESSVKYLLISTRTSLFSAFRASGRFTRTSATCGDGRVNSTTAILRFPSKLDVSSDLVPERLPQHTLEDLSGIFARKRRMELNKL